MMLIQGAVFSKLKLPLVNTHREQTRLLLTTAAGDGPGDPVCPSVS